MRHLLGIDLTDRLVRSDASIVILTGAGISAESGLATFRGPDGLWEGHRVEDVCTPEALASVKPNAAHHALARLDTEWPGDLLIVTQNVDDLHERAGAKRLLHIHGELLSALCVACGERDRFTGAMLGGTVCTRCGAIDRLRPDIVFFGEIPYEMERIEAALSNADIFVSIGTSGAVYPAAGFVRLARAAGAQTLELNLDPSEGSFLFDEARQGPASQLVPVWVEAMLS